MFNGLSLLLCTVIWYVVIGLYMLLAKLEGR